MGTSFSENAGVAKKSLKKVTLGMLLGDIWEGLGRIVDAGGRLFREKGRSKRGQEISSILGSILGSPGGNILVQRVVIVCFGGPNSLTLISNCCLLYSNRLSVTAGQEES